jgi:hypothetical protein
MRNTKKRSLERIASVLAAVYKIVDIGLKLYGLVHGH